MADPIQQHRRRQAARVHLTRRYAPQIAAKGPEHVLAELDALQQVATYARPADVSRDDVRAALELVPEAREHLDWLELQLLSYARRPHLSWLTWQEIAEALGLESRQAAEVRYRRLLARFPDAVAAPGAVLRTADMEADERGEESIR